MVISHIATLKEQDYDRILEECQNDMVNFFVRILIDETGEFDIRDKLKLQKFVRAYIDQIKVSGDNKNEVLFKNRGKIANDMLSQIQAQIKEKTVINYTVTNKSAAFEDYRRNFPKGYADKQKDKVVEDDLTHNIIAGYQKTVFTKNIFDSKPEKCVADILDRDKEVKRWVRPPTGQMPIEYKLGAYNPDFVIETKDGKFYLMEVKSRKEVEEAQAAPDSHEVALKYQAGKTWCEAMAKATKKDWSYKLIPDDAINANQSFQGIISNAVVI